MKKPSLNSNRERILYFIHEFIDEHGYSPTVRDILRGCEISSTAVVQYHLDVLVKEGRIHRDPEIFRSITVSQKKGTILIPILGTIAAGEPIPVPNSDNWANQSSETLEIPQDMIGNKQVFALKVKGQSMIDALIDDGDIVLMEKSNSAENGEMVAIWLKDSQEVTLKKFYMESNKVLLKPANQQLQPIQQSPENVEIQGKVIGVIRKL